MQRGFRNLSDQACLIFGVVRIRFSISWWWLQLVCMDMEFGELMSPIIGRSIVEPNQVGKCPWPADVMIPESWY